MEGLITPEFGKWIVAGLFVLAGSIVYLSALGSMVFWMEYHRRKRTETLEDDWGN